MSGVEEWAEDIALRPAGTTGPPTFACPCGCGARMGCFIYEDEAAQRLSQLEHDHLVAKVGVRNVPTSAGGTGRDEATWSLVL